VCGTGTGGILALATAIRHKSAEECITLYKKIFTKSITDKYKNHSTYATPALERTMKAFLGEEPMHKICETPKVILNNFNFY
jgi:hypothetical protein